jgi:RsiW-degrading membrane proteinase PrsW (M82 family)
VVRVRLPANATVELRERYPDGLIPEEGLVHPLTRRETVIGRSLDSDVVLLDPTVSREHARLVYSDRGWCVQNLTAQNAVRVNGEQVAGGTSITLHPQDVLVLGSTMLQLIAPRDPQDLQQTLQLPQVVPHHQSPVLSSSSFSTRHTPSHLSALQPEVPLVASDEIATWDEEDEENVLGAGVTMQFAIPQRLGRRTRWFMAGVGITILVVSTILTLVFNSIVGISAFVQNGFSSVFAALTIPLLPAIGITFLVNFIDRYEREPWFLRLSAFLWGAIIAIPPTILIETSIAQLMQNALSQDANILLRSLLQGVSVGITEETVKGLGLLLLFLVLRDEFDNVTDGIVYGALIGAGFAMVENFIYFAYNAKDFLLFLFVGRIVLGWLCHSTYTVCLGAALGYVRHTRVRWKQIAIPLVGFLIAVGLHSLFDFVDLYANAAVLAAPHNARVTLFSLIAIVADYIPPFLAQMALLYILIKSLAHESAIIREFLASEVSNGVIQVNEYVLLQNSFQRTKQERQMLRRCGVKQWQRVCSLYQTEIGLAFRKWHVSMGDKPKLGYRQPEDAYRQRIKRLRQEIARNM